MSKMLNLRKGQKMFIQAKDVKKGCLRDYLGYLEEESEDFFLLRIEDKKHSKDYFYLIPKNLITGSKLYWEIKTFEDSPIISMNA